MSPPASSRADGDARSTFLVALLLAVAALGVHRTQPRLAAAAHAAKEGEEVYSFPPPRQVKALVFGYDAAALDLLWAKLLVEYGIHWRDKRTFHPDPYMDAIAYLDPTYAPLYRFADTLLCYHPLHATEADARKTRALLEAGTRARPWDFEVWQEYGQFAAFLGPGFLSSATKEEKDRWRRDGALAIMKAVELGAPVGDALSAATILGRTGETNAAIEFLQRQYAVNYDNPDVRAEIAGKLGRLSATAQNEEEERAMGALQALWEADWRFLNRDELLLLGPFPNVAKCAGTAAADDPACTREWNAFMGIEPRSGGR